MKTLLKKFNIGSLIILLVAGVVMTAQSAFTSAKLDPPTDGWYHLSVIDDQVDPDLASNLAIGSYEPTAPPLTDDEGCAQQDNEGSRCMIYLDFTNLATSVPETVADVNSTYESITNEARSPEL
ncbi:hypothetical protein [Pedobacter faecalis]|uniref:hypothetical protein n=1 Tax=Pedobacter faecalis TaxID=3041495 RepID=UPI00254CF70C|nr:hypothetical protein [Pedobacter sp. ELA7]